MATSQSPRMKIPRISKARVCGFTLVQSRSAATPSPGSPTHTRSRAVMAFAKTAPDQAFRGRNLSLNPQPQVEGNPKGMMKTNNVIGENYGFIESVFAFLTIVLPVVLRSRQN